MSSKLVKDLANPSEKAKALIWMVIFLIISIALPVGFYLNYTEVEALIDRGQDGIISIDERTFTSRRGSHYYEAFIDRYPVRIYTKKNLLPGYTYPVIYDSGELSTYKRESGSFYGYILGSKKQGPWAVFRQDWGDFLLWGTGGIVIFFLIAAFKCWRVYKEKDNT